MKIFIGKKEIKLIDSFVLKVGDCLPDLLYSQEEVAEAIRQHRDK